MSYIRHISYRVCTGRQGQFCGEIVVYEFRPDRPLRRGIRQSLQSGEWKPGELMPSEVELAVRFKVSQGTVRKAIDELAAENLVVRRQGKGTFVATHHEERAHFRFLKLMPDEGAPRPHEN